MPTPVVLLSGFVKPVGMSIQPGTNNVFVGQKDGKIFKVDPAVPALTQVGAAPGQINGLDVTADGQTAYVVGNLLGVTAVSLSGGINPRLLRGLVAPAGVYLDPAAGALLAIEGRTPGRLYSLRFHPTRAVVVARGLQNARAVLRQQATGRILVAEATAGGRVVEPVGGGPATVLVAGLGAPVDLAWFAADETRLLVTDRMGKRVLLVDLNRPSDPPLELLSGLDDLWAAQLIAADKVLIGAGAALLLGTVVVPPRDPVELHVPVGELFVAGWVRVPVTIRDPAIAFDDLEYHVKPAESAAMVSYSRDKSFDPAQPHVLLTAGWRTGKHELVAVHRPSAQHVGASAFEVLDNWTHPRLGPSLSTFGSVESGPSGSTWGGADSGDFRVPQNVAVNPALGTWNVGVVLVDTATARYPTGAALTTILTNLRNEMVNGVMAGGQTRSVSLYFNQASSNAFNINLVGVAGPINLPNNWNSYFTMKPIIGWDPIPDLETTIIAQLVQQNWIATQAGSPPVLDLSQMHSLIFVIRSFINTPPNPDLFVWPQASLSREARNIGSIPLPFPPMELPVFRDIARLFMPDDWAARDGWRQFHETVVHELGHNLGLNDQYSLGPITPTNPGGHSADAISRIADFVPNQSWEVMSWERDLPLPSAAHRLMLGWLNPSWVRLYNFGVVGPVDETITLHAASLGAPPAGRFAAVEVRLEDGKNYYFEYRPAVAGRIVDPNPPEANTVLGTEAEFRSAKPADRPHILRVEEDADAVDDRGAFATGEDFRDQDTTTPGFTNDFIVDVVATTADSARVRFRYAADNKPDPGMTPWSPSTNWQSPDIEVSNGRSLADSAFGNIPWEGHDNTVVARVINRGSSSARGVKVKFFAKEFTLGTGTELPLGEQTQDIAVGATVTFTAPQPWRPPVVTLPFPLPGGSIPYQQHSCLVARIDPFLDPVSNIWEVTPENNEAQSNYTWMASTTSSPSTRAATVVVAENPLQKPAIIYFTVNQPHPLFRTYLDHRWVYLEPGEKRQILVMVESLYGDPRFERLTRDFQHGERRVTTTLRLSALGDTRQNCAAEIIGGVSILVMAGVDTRFERFEAHRGWGEGFVVRTDTGAGVNGKVLISVLPNQPGPNSKEIVLEVQAHAGRFGFENEAIREALVQAHFLGGFPYGPSDSKPVRI